MIRNGSSWFKPLGLLRCPETELSPRFSIRTRIRVIISRFADRAFLFAFLFKAVALSGWIASDILTVTPKFQGD